MAQTETFPMGVEEEYQVIDPLTHELSADVERILPHAQESLDDAVQYEMILSQIEIATPVCSTLQEVEQQLTSLRRGVIQAAATVGKEIGAAGTHPFSPWETQVITPKEKYQKLVETYQQLVREQIIFGCHVHIGIDDHEIAAQIMNHARLWLSPLLALTANSPFWCGADTGYSSYRTGLWGTIPLSGPPPYFNTRAEYDNFLEQLLSTRSIDDPARLYWDIRLSQRYPTIEFRVTDVCLTVREAVMIAGLIRALVQQSYTLIRNGTLAPNVPGDLVRIANWRAARFGLHGDLMDLHEQQPTPAHEAINRLLHFVRPALEATNDWQRISSDVKWLLQAGNGADRQRAIYQQTGQFQDVVDFIVSETHPD